jgi:hypothetical protein
MVDVIGEDGHRPLNKLAKKYDFENTEGCREELNGLVYRYKLIGKYSALASAVAGTKWGKTLKDILAGRVEVKHSTAALDVEVLGIEERAAVLFRYLFPCTLPFSGLTSYPGVFLFEDMPMAKEEFDRSVLKQLINLMPHDVV